MERTLILGLAIFVLGAILIPISQLPVEHETEVYDLLMMKTFDYGEPIRYSVFVSKEKSYWLEFGGDVNAGWGSDDQHWLFMRLNYHGGGAPIHYPDWCGGWIPPISEEAVIWLGRTNDPDINNPETSLGSSTYAKLFEIVDVTVTLYAFSFLLYVGIALVVISIGTTAFLALHSRTREPLT